MAGKETLRLTTSGEITSASSGWFEAAMGQEGDRHCVKDGGDDVGA